MTLSSKALILIDIQNDFLPGGSLPVKEGDRVIPIANRMMKMDFDFILASKDWHPNCHSSFASTHNKKPGEVTKIAEFEQVLWPDHCVQESKGSEFPPTLDSYCIQKIFYKGTDPLIDSYSTFFDNAHKRSTGLNEFLKEKGVKTLYLMGLATDYCVLFSVLDAIKNGFETFVVIDGCRGVELVPGDTRIALDVMKRTGATLLNSSDVHLKSLPSTLNQRNLNRIYS